jgi:hypothetical protein
MPRTRAIDQQSSYAHARPPTAAAAPGDPLALIVWHGMGQQIRFQAVEDVVRSLTAGSAGPRPTVDTRFVKFGDDAMWRAEFDCKTSHGRVQRLHVYEVYWAPLTEGKITIGETLAFLVRAGLAGLWYATRGNFRRHLFGEWVTFPSSASTALQLAALMLTIAAMVILNFAIATATSVTVFTGGASSWPGYPLLGDLTADFLIYELTMGGMLFALWVTWKQQKTPREDGRPSTRHSWMKWPLWILVFTAMATTIAAGAFVVAHFWRHHTPNQVMAWRWPAWLVGAVYGYVPLSLDIVARIAAIWVIAVAVSYYVKLFLVEYVGDVAIYIASHKLDRFYEARQAIKAESMRVMKAIYQHGKYKSHICVGHSLGSVVAYDTLNRMLNESQVVKGLDVAKKTRALLTFGSPLDKTAFLFRAQSEFSDVREAMAAAAQPLITDYDLRPIWINISAPGDPISGDLDYYDDPKREPSATARRGAVFNMKDPEAWIPLVAHTQYWTNSAFVNTLRSLIGNDNA